MNYIQIVDKIIPLEEKSKKKPYKMNKFSPKTHAKFKLVANLFFRFGQQLKNKQIGDLDQTPSLPYLF